MNPYEIIFPTKKKPKVSVLRHTSRKKKLAGTENSQIKNGSFSAYDRLQNFYIKLENGRFSFSPAGTVSTSVQLSTGMSCVGQDRQPPPPPPTLG